MKLNTTRSKIRTASRFTSFCHTWKRSTARDPSNISATSLVTKAKTLFSVTLSRKIMRWSWVREGIQNWEFFQILRSRLYSRKKVSQITKKCLRLFLNTLSALKKWDRKSGFSKKIAKLETFRLILLKREIRWVLVSIWLARCQSFRLLKICNT